MAGRQQSKEAMAIFDKYTANKARQLNRPEAINMLSKEFGLEESQAGAMFDMFDKDLNGVMSIWEFEAFHKCVGENASSWVDKFLLLDKDGSGKLDMEEAKAGMLQMRTTSSGHSLSDKEIEFFLKTAAGDDNAIDLKEFVELLFRLKVYKPPGAAGPKKKR